jgi:hypothetical protein
MNCSPVNGLRMAAQSLVTSPARLTDSDPGNPQ